MPADPQIVTALGNTDLFGALSKRALKRLADSMKVSTHGAGQAVTSEGEGAVAFHLILEGTATVTIKGKTVNKLGPGDYFGEIALLDGKPRTATVTAESQLRSAGLSTWQFRPLLTEVDDLAVNLLIVLCQRIRHAQLD